MIVLVGNVTQVNIGAINYARSIGDYVIAMHVSLEENEEKEREIRHEFREKFPDVRFSVVRSPYRSIVNPVSRYVDRVSKNAKEHNYTTTVLIPEFVPNRTWKRSLHNQTALRLRFRLSYRDDIIISTYNYHLKK